MRSTEVPASSAKISPVMKLAKLTTSPALDVRPLGVGAGQAGDAVEARLGGEQAGDLGLLAAHHVGRAVLAQARQDADRRAAGRRVGAARSDAGVGGQGTAA